MALNIQDIRTFSVTGHGGCGKTSLAEAILFKSGALTRLGSVDAGQTASDYTQEEKDRKISIYTTPLKFDWKKGASFMLDTPGYQDFFSDVICAMEVSDTVLLVVDAISGVDVGTQRVWQYAEKNKIPCAIFVTKLDKEYADFAKAVEGIQEVFGPKCVPVVFPVGKEAALSDVADILDEKGLGKLDPEAKKTAEGYRAKLTDLAAEGDDALLEKFLGGIALSADEMQKGLKTAIGACRFVPVLCGSSAKQVGIEMLLDKVRQLFCSPLDREAPKTADGKPVKPDAAGKFTARVFKNISDPYIGRFTYLRILAGTLHANTEIYNVNHKSKERFGQFYHLVGKEQHAVETAGPGEIVAIAKLKNVALGDTFTGGNEDVLMPPFVLPKPMVSFAIASKNKGDEEKMATGLHRLAEEDPAMIPQRNAQTHELTVSVMGEMHLNVIMDKLKHKYGVEAQFSVPKVAYKETIRAKGEGHEKHKKQTGGRGQYGDVYLRIAPKAHGDGYEFVNAIVGGVIPRNFIPAVEKGVLEAMHEGPQAGCPVVDIEVTVYDGSYHDVDSSEIAFKIAGSKAFKDAFMKASPCLLEPIMDVAATVPQEYMGDITGLYNSKRGRVMGMESLGRMQTIRANVPIAEMFNFSNELRSLTGGRGSYVMEFSHYEEVPGMIARKVAEEYQKTRKEETE